MVSDRHSVRSGAAGAATGAGGAARPAPKAESRESIFLRIDTEIGTTFFLEFVSCFLFCLWVLHGSERLLEFLLQFF